MHRGRPRSRKHVEVHAGVSNASDNKKTRLQVESTTMAVTIPTTPASQINNRSTKQPLRSTFQQIQSPLFFHDDKIGGNGNISTDPSYNELHRFFFSCCFTLSLSLSPNLRYIVLCFVWLKNFGLDDGR